MATTLEPAARSRLAPGTRMNPFAGSRSFHGRRQRHPGDAHMRMYDAVGQWTYAGGVPAKSGVSRGILAAVPGKGGIGVFSPGLDVYGNSVRGIAVCRELSEGYGLHVFASDFEDAMLAIVSSAMVPRRWVTRSRCGS